MTDGTQGVRPQLDAVVLVDNAEVEGLVSEWGLSVHLTYGGLRMLLDFGQSDAFARNAQALGIDLAKVDLAVLSHAHYDHANGIDHFLSANDHAPVYLSDAATQSCYSTSGGTQQPHYIGIRPHTLERCRDRLRFVSHTQPTRVTDGVWLLPHGGDAAEGDAPSSAAGMLLLVGDTFVRDEFDHELTLVIETRSRLCVASSCTHLGLPRVVSEVSRAFPGAPIGCFLGGLHLMHANEREVAQVAAYVRKAAIGTLMVGHCTGGAALERLRDELGPRVRTIGPGAELRM